MRVQFKRVFYCDFCRKHGLRADAMLRHEGHCTLNPARECGFRDVSEHVLDVPELAAQVAERGSLTEGDISWLETQAHGCPSCMLAAVRQSGLGYENTKLFDYREQVATLFENMDRQYA